jgi:Protein of unknown function (DUF4058)
MRPPFPGMDPYLEHPALWPDVHNRLIAAIADAVTPLVVPRYYVGVERRSYVLKPDDVALVGISDVAVLTPPATEARGALAPAGVAVLEVDVPINDEVGENFLEVHDVTTGTLVTTLELLSPVNKLHTQRRQEYEQKRDQVFRSRTNRVEVDLLRAGEPMPVRRRRVRSDYSILVSRGAQRPRAQLYAFGLRQPIPAIPLPLLPGDAEPPVDLGAILHALYDRARFDLRLDYTRPPVPPLADDDAAWARELLRG